MLFKRWQHFPKDLTEKSWSAYIWNQQYVYCGYSGRRTSRIDLRKQNRLGLCSKLTLFEEGIDLEITKWGEGKKNQRRSWANSEKERRIACRTTEKA